MNLLNFLVPSFLTQPFIFPPYFYAQPVLMNPPPVPSPVPSSSNYELPDDVILEHEVDMAQLEERLQVLHSGDRVYRKIHWTIQEDEELRKLVEVDKLDWKEIPRFFKDRTQNMCYSRYRRITVCGKKRTWTKEDEQIVINHVNSIGQKWKVISQALPKFTAKQIRQRYLNSLRHDLNKNEFKLEEDRMIARYVIANGKHWRKMEELLPGRSEGAIKGRYYSKLCSLIRASRIQH